MSITRFVYYWEVLDRLPPSPLGVFAPVITKTSTRDHEVLSLVMFDYSLYALKGFFTYRILIHSGKRFQEIY